MSAQPVVLDAQELTTSRDCTVPGCTGVDAGIMGPYKGKCERHCAEVRERQRQAQLNRSEHGAASTAPQRAAAGSLEQAARELVALGRKADRAQAKAAAAVQEARAVKGDYDAAKQAFQQLARELAGG